MRIEREFQNPEVIKLLQTIDEDTLVELAKKAKLLSQQKIEKDTKSPLPKKSSRWGKIAQSMREDAHFAGISNEVTQIFREFRENSSFEKEK